MKRSASFPASSSWRGWGSSGLVEEIREGRVAQWAPTDQGVGKEGGSARRGEVSSENIPNFWTPTWGPARELPDAWLVPG